MANIDPTAADWAPIPMLDTDTPALAGPGGPMNAQAEAIARRLNYLRSQISSVESGFVPYETASQLPTSDPGEGKRLMFVWGDVSSENNGVWAWDSSASAPVKSEYITSQLLSAVSADVAQLNIRPGAGMTELFNHPNVFTDVNFTRWIAGTAAGSSPADGSGLYIVGANASVSSAIARDGRPALRFTSLGSGFNGNNIRWSVPISRIGVADGEYVSASIKIDSYDMTGSGRVFLRQLRSDGQSIDSVRQAFNLMAGSGSDVLVTLGPVQIDPECARVEMFIDAANAGSVYVLTNVMLAKGQVTDYRPATIGLLNSAEVESIAMNASAKSSLDAALNPNFVHASSFNMTDLAPVASLINAAVVPDIVGEVKAWKLTWPGSGSEGGVYLGPFPSAKFATGKVSAHVTVTKVDAASAGTARVLLIQYDSSGAEITSARQAKNISVSGSPVSIEVAVGFDSITLHPDCTNVRLYVGLTGSGSARSMWFNGPSVYDGSYSGARVPQDGGAAVATVTSVYVGPSGSDSNTGTKSSPKATVDAAITAINGNGTVYLLPGTYGGGARISYAGVTDRVEFIGIRSSMGAGSYDYPIVDLGQKVTGIVKTSGRTKVYQAAVSGLPTLANFNWCYQHGVADAATEITDYRQPQHCGRTHRTPWFTRIVKTTATTLSAALDEIDASATPKAFVDDGVLYFSIAGGGDAATADIRMDAAQTMIPTLASAKGSAGSLIIRGVTVLYGGLDLRAFAYAELDEVIVAGSRANCVDYNVLRYGTLETCCAGSASGSTGDGLNGHTGAVLYGDGDLYSHDCRDDGFSDHEGCTSRLNGGGLVEYNGGTGICPAYGADSIARGFVSVRNQRRTGHKAAAFYVHAAPSVGTPPESGYDTRGMFVGCTDYESDTSFADDYTRVGTSVPAFAVCVDCKSVKPVTRAYNVSKIIDCGYVASATSTAKNPATVVENTTLVG